MRTDRQLTSISKRVFPPVCIFLSFILKFEITWKGELQENARRRNGASHFLAFFRVPLVCDFSRYSSTLRADSQGTVVLVHHASKTTGKGIELYPNFSLFKGAG